MLNRMFGLAGKDANAAFNLNFFSYTIYTRMCVMFFMVYLTIFFASVVLLSNFKETRLVRVKNK